MRYIVVKIQSVREHCASAENEYTRRGEHKNGIPNAVRAISHRAHCTRRRGRARFAPSWARAFRTVVGAHFARSRRGHQPAYALSESHRKE